MNDGLVSGLTVLSVYVIFTARCYVQCGIAMASRLFVRLPVRLSVTLRYCGRIGSVSSKIITPADRLGSSLSAVYNIISLVKGEHR